MDGNYEVTKDGSAVGKVQVIKTGLYYRFICRCRLKSDDVSRLIAAFGDDTVSLGVLIPEGEGFSLDKKLSIKQFPQGQPSFRVKPLNEEEKPVPPRGKFVPLSSEEPFPYLDQLKDSHFMQQEGITGLWIPEEEGGDCFQESSSSNPTGQWSEPKISE